MRKIVVKGRIPSKKNEKISMVRNGKLFIMPSKRFKEWHEQAVWDLKIQNIELIENVERVEIVLYAPDKRRSDLTNKAESLMDLLVDVKILEDDNWFIVGDIHLKFGGVDRENPRAEIFIKEKENDIEGGGDTIS